MTKSRYSLLFKGIVQGVGFRPFIYREAIRFQLYGFVKNTSAGVVVEIEGENCDNFISYVKENPPPIAVIEEISKTELKCNNCTSFQILKSDKNDAPGDILIPPDIALCKNCEKELFESDDIRYLYPFINCTDCGPRYTIIENIPYDRPFTTMKSFELCNYCNQEYIDPLNRRYHAQPVACKTCGPELEFLDSDGKTHDDPLNSAIDKLRNGHVVAIKGLGGYHLACSALDSGALDKIRSNKNRGNKPFALMGTLDMIKKYCYVDEYEENLLLEPSAPILLLRKKSSKLQNLIAKGHNRIGFMVPYTPLHVLLIREMDSPLVMTSANTSDEPIIYEDDYDKLFNLSDFILTNNRDIHMFTDDSVAAVFKNNLYMFRRSRGYVPFPIKVPIKNENTILGIGAFMKTTFSFLYRGRALMSQYIGTTNSVKTITTEMDVIRHFQKIFSITPDTIAVDTHPGYPNRIITSEYPDANVIEVQHHKAHLASLMADNNFYGKIIGITMDGTGYGDDGKIWGGEFFAGDLDEFKRYAHLKYSFLPAGDKSVKEPWRYALSLLNELEIEESYIMNFLERFGNTGKMQLKAIKHSVGGIETSSCGRFFDAISVLTGIGDKNTYDGELPSLLQSYAERSNSNNFCYRYNIYEEKNMQILNLLPTVYDIINDSQSIENKAFGFHFTIAAAITEMAEIGRNKFNINTVGLSGGVFQNLLLLDLTVKLLEEKGFEILIHKRIPANDSGISLGQAILAAQAIKKGD